MHPRVIATIPNALGDLLAWGRDGRGWWGLVCWSHRTKSRDQLGGDVRYSAWMPAWSLRPSRYDTVDYHDVVRLDLPADHRTWPSPSDRHDLECEHFGVWTDRQTARYIESMSGRRVPSENSGSGPRGTG